MVQDLQKYETWFYKDVKIPLSSLSYPNTKTVHIEIHEVAYFKHISDSYINGTTKIDAWMIPNHRVELYVKNREAIASEIIKQLKQKGYKNIQRSYLGSQDGEAISAQKANASFFSHLDPMLVSEYENSLLDLKDFVSKHIDTNA